MTTPPWKHQSETAVAWFGVIAVIFGGGFSFCEYREKQDQWRTEKTLSLIERADKAPYATAREKTETVWLENTDKIKQALEDAAEKDLNRQKVYNLKLFEMVEENKIKFDILMVIKMYDQIAICMRQSVCSSTAVIDMVGREMVSFYDRWFPFLTLHCKRTFNKRFAVHLSSFVRLVKNLSKVNDKTAGIAKPNHIRLKLISDWKNEDAASAVNPDCAGI